jgi:prophage DNA circulation protein
LIDIVALSGRHDARLAEVAAAVARLGDLDPAIRAAVTTGDRLEERLDALQTAVTAALGERLDSLAAHVTAAADAVSSAAGSITSLNNTVARLDSAVAGIRPAGVEGELAALNDRLTELGQSIHGIRAEVDGLRNLARHTGDIVETRTAVSRILSAVGNTPSAHSSAPANGE